MPPAPPKVRAPFNAPNTDAIDPGPVTHAWIHHCDIDTGDDDIVIKSGGTNVLIEDCTIKHGHGISIGSETTVGVHNMLVRRCEGIVAYLHKLRCAPVAGSGHGHYSG